MQLHHRDFMPEISLNHLKKLQTKAFFSRSIEELIIVL